MQSLRQTSLLIGLLYLTTVYLVQAQPACVKKRDRDIDYKGEGEYMKPPTTNVNADECCALCQSQQPQCLAFKHYDGGAGCYLFTKLSSQTEHSCSTPCTSAIITSGCEHLPDTNINVEAGGSKIFITMNGIVDATTCCAHCKGRQPNCVAYVYHGTDKMCHLIEKLGRTEVKAGFTSGFMKSCSNDVRAQTGMWRANTWLQSGYNTAYIADCCAKCMRDDRCIAFVYDSDKKYCGTTDSPGAEKPKLPTKTVVYVRKGYYKHCNITLTTGGEDEAGTGTAQYVSIQLTGEHGQKTRWLWLGSGDDEFERNSVKDFQVYAKDIGKVTGVRVTKRDVAMGEKWKPERVDVSVPEGKQYSFAFDLWLEYGRREVHGRAISATDKLYKMTVTTADEDGAGTISSVYTKFEGQTGTTNEVRLHSARNDFQQGATDYFTAYFTDVGKLKSVTLRVSGLKSWKPSKVIVKIEQHWTFIFNFNRWISKNAPATVVAQETDATGQATGATGRTTDEEAGKTKKSGGYTITIVIIVGVVGFFVILALSFLITTIYRKKQRKLKQNKSVSASALPPSDHDQSSADPSAKAQDRASISLNPSDTLYGVPGLDAYTHLNVTDRTDHSAQSATPSETPPTATPPKSKSRSISKSESVKETQ